METPEYFILKYAVSGFEDVCRTEVGYYQTLARRFRTDLWKARDERFIVDGGATALGRVIEISCEEAVAIRLQAEEPA